MNVVLGCRYPKCASLSNCPSVFSRWTKISRAELVRAVTFRIQSRSLVGAALCFERMSRSAMPAELLWLSGRALAEHDVDQRRSAVVHRLVEGAADVLWILDKKALAAKGFHDTVITRAIDQRVGLHVEHRIFRDLGHAGADAA